MKTEKTLVAEIIEGAGGISLAELFMRAGERQNEVAALIKSGMLKLEDTARHDPQIEKALQKKDESDILAFLNANASGESAEEIEVIPTIKLLRRDFFPPA